jgi:hypothetical protein
MSTLSMWVVYDHPRDYPAGFIARRHEVRPGESTATADVLQAWDIEDLRKFFVTQGFHCLAREEKDDPVIVETWL